MEAVDPDVEPPLFWLVENILENLGLFEMQVWFHQVGLNDITERLKLEVERAEPVIAAVEGRVAKPLVRLLGRLMELLYDADDVVDELDYHRIRQQVETGMIASADEPQGTDVAGVAHPGDGSRDNSGIQSTKGDKRRSSAWDHFNVTDFDKNRRPVAAVCKYCQSPLKCRTGNGTSVLLSHLQSQKCIKSRGQQLPNCSSSPDLETDITASRTSKRKRTDESSTLHTPLETVYWNKDKSCSKIEQIIRQLQITLGALSEALKLRGLHCPSSPANHQPATSGPGPTAPLFEGKIYGRSAEKESLIKLMKRDSSDVITVVPIVGIGGIGKTALAQFAYNCSDPDLKFDHRLWVSISYRFDVARLLKGMLDSLSQGRGEGIDDLPLLQKVLKNFMESKKLLIIFDEIWDSMDTSKWKNLMALLKHCKAKRIVLLVTTRSLSVAKLVGTDESISLDSMGEDDFWLLFRESAFGDDRNKEHPFLNAIGQKLVKKLNGNPLAAETAGMLLREHLTIDNWNSILKYEKWKSLELRGGIMSSLKRSYNLLSENLKQCFRYCCVFPKNHYFYLGGERLIRSWISLGFVHSSHNGEEIEDIANKYLNDLVKCGLLEQDKTRLELICMNNLMHDLAREISKSEIATIDGSDLADIGPTVRHLSVVAVSQFHGTALCHDFFNKKMKKVTSLKNLRSLLIIGSHDEHFRSDYHNILKEAKKLRLLEIGEELAPFLCDLSSTHIRQLKVQSNMDGRKWSLSLSMFYHMQVLDAKNISNLYGLNNLLSMRFLCVSVGARSSSIAEMGDQQAVQCFELTQVRSMNKLVHLRLLRLENGNKDEANAAKLREKQLLENLYLSWTESYNGQSSEHGTNSEGMLEGLEPHLNLKHLHIRGYSGATSPSWLATSVTRLQTLVVQKSRELRKLPSLARLSYLTFLELDNLQEVSNLSFPPLEVLQLTEMPKLEMCSCNSVKLLNSRLRVMFLRGCHALKDFPLFENSEKLQFKEESWMPSLSELHIIDCPHLIIPYPLPPNGNVALTLFQQPNLPRMLQSSRKLLVQVTEDDVILIDQNVLAFQRLSLLSELAIHGKRDITCVVFSSSSEFINLHRLDIHDCKEIWFSDVSQEDTSEHMTGLKYLKQLGLFSCGIKENHLSRMLQLLPVLEELSVGSCNLTGSSLEENRSGSILIPEASLSRAPSSSIQGGLCIPSNLITLKTLCIEDSRDLVFFGGNDSLTRFTSLQYLILDGPNLFSSLVYDTGNNGKSVGRLFLSESLTNLALQVTYSSGIGMEGIPQCPDVLQLCFPRNQTHLQILKLKFSNLKSLQLNFCTELEELEIGECELLTGIEGLQFLDNLRHIILFDSPNLLQFLECHATYISKLESIEIDSYYILTTSFCSYLNSLLCLKFVRADALLRLTPEHESALRLLTSLQELHFLSCNYLEDLPDCLHDLPSLNKLEISSCPSISKLPVMGLPTWLEELKISHCSEQLTQQCRMLATITRQPKVNIDYICEN